MKQLDFTSVYLLVLFILPGFLSYVIARALYQEERKDSEIEVIYKSVLYSGSIYIALFFLAVSFNVWIENFVLIRPRLSILIVIIASHVWGVIVFLFKRFDLFFKLLSFIRIVGTTQPPNLYAALLDPKYQPRAKHGCWVIFRKGDVTYEGFVEYTDVVKDDRLVYVTEVREIDQNRQMLVQHPNTFGMMVDLKKVEWLDIFYGE